MKSIIISVIIILFSLNIWAQKNKQSDYFQTIKGVVYDIESGKKLHYANVYLEDDESNGSYTDVKGRYEFLVTTGRHHVVISLVGYRVRLFLF